MPPSGTLSQGLTRSRTYGPRITNVGTTLILPVHQGVPAAVTVTFPLSAARQGGERYRRVLRKSSGSCVGQCCREVMRGLSSGSGCPSVRARRSRPTALLGPDDIPASGRRSFAACFCSQAITMTLLRCGRCANVVACTQSRTASGALLLHDHRHHYRSPRR